MKNSIYSLLLFPILATAGEYPQAAEQLVNVGHFFNGLGLCAATAGNFSTRVDSDLILITVSGKHKGELTADDVMLVNLEGKAQNTTKRPSAETALHTVVYRHFPSVGAVLHTHSVNGTVLSRLLAPKTAFVTEGYEIHKIFPGISTHESTVTLPIFENSQDYVTLSADVSNYLQTHPQTYGFYLRGHGLYTWGKDVKEAQVRTEAIEFLFDCELKTQLIR
ncbi:MAG: methylthioribulose 1-phosphate dehydratase [Candidatus Melainabacteria bacterium]|nr:methylthioribulose 1-phosphate dehydratase [Candidatus Melainabacteria bacterium]